jgi:hypothetical protein
MLLASIASAQRPEPPSVKYVICSAYSAMMAAVMNSRKLLNEAEKMGRLAETHAAIAIALDELEGLPAWATRDLVSQLTANLKSQATTQGAVLDLAAKRRGLHSVATAIS